MKDINELTVEEQVTRDCPILFRMRHRPCIETTMCFGFECLEGWHKAIASACRELEMLNMQYYPKYRVRIQADQIKEKYGQMCFYWSVVVDPNAFCTWLGRKAEQLHDWILKSFDFKMKKIVDVSPHVKVIKTAIDKETYDKGLNDKCKPVNVVYKESDGMYYKICNVDVYEKCHYVPTRLIWYLMRLCLSLKHMFFNVRRTNNAKVRNCIEFMDRKAAKIVHALEKECDGICEQCGHTIGTDWSPECKTTGYISYICECCAEKLGRNYIKNGELWNGKNRIKTKEEIAERHED